MRDRSGSFAGAASPQPASTDGTGYLSLTYRDAAALPWLDTDNLADRTRTFFDAKANPTKTVLPDDNYVPEQFDPIFNELTQYTNENGDTTTYGLDAHGNVTTTTDALNKTWHNTYDSRGRLTLATDPYASDSTTFAYDDLGPEKRTAWNAIKLRRKPLFISQLR